jgi:hypothetical protein
MTAITLLKTTLAVSIAAASLLVVPGCFYGHDDHHDGWDHHNDWDHHDYHDHHDDHPDVHVDVHP